MAVLALEGLFGMIVRYNLDYPKYFEALYTLCTPIIFAAKYRTKFLDLLCKSLRSTNIPAYTAAAFIKRFATIALHGEAPTACFCLAMVITLLRAHPKCMVMIHRSKLISAAAGCNQEPFDDRVVHSDFERLNALSTSLWELDTLRNHFVPDVVKLVLHLEHQDSTDVMKAPVNPSEYIHLTYPKMVKRELAKVQGCIDEIEKKRKLEMYDEVIVPDKGKRRRSKHVNGFTQRRFDYKQEGSVAAQTFTFPTDVIEENSCLRLLGEGGTCHWSHDNHAVCVDYRRENTDRIKDSIFAALADARFEGIQTENELAELVHKE